ncbi:nucleic acid-binding, OB-fold protein [Tanacetum coccineum]
MKNSLYGYFSGKRLSFPVVEWFVRNNWKKYGLEKVTLVKVFFFFKFSSTEGVDSVLRDGPWMIRGVPLFLNKWSPSVSLLKEELSCVPVWVKFHDVLLVTYTSDGLSLITMKIVMVVPNLEGPGYSKETIHVEYEWEPPRCNTCLIFGHSIVDCPKAQKRVVNRVDKGKGRSFGADNEGFVEVKKKKSGGNNEGNNGKKNVSTSSNSSKMANMTDASTSGNGTVSLSNSFEVLNVDDPANVKVESSNKASTSSVQEEGQSATPLVEKINIEDEDESVDNDMANFVASKLSGVGYGTKSSMEQYREAYGNAEYGYDPYVDDLYEGREILTIFNLYAIILISRFEVKRRNRLLDVESIGDAIQANMDINNIEHFNPRLKLGDAYRISRFICETTSSYHQTLQNKTSLRFGKITNFEILTWQEQQFPNHHFKFVSYNQLGSRVPYRGENSKMVYPVLADYLGCIRSISDALPFENANRSQSFRRKVDIQNLDGNIVEFTMWDDLATQFDKKMIEKIEPPVIIAVTSCKFAAQIPAGTLFIRDVAATSVGSIRGAT